MKKFTGNKAGTGGVVTFNNYNWVISIVLPHQPYFMDQPKGTFICLGYGLSCNRHGNHINKKMSDCTGQEILEEMCFHLGFTDRVDEIIKSAICIPTISPYVTSQFSPRIKTDRPKVVPNGSVNLACIGQSAGGGIHR